MARTLMAAGFTRKALTRQLADALERLGSDVTPFTCGTGALTYIIRGRFYTPGQLADVLLEGGAQAAIGRAETVLSETALRCGTLTEALAAAHTERIF